MIRRRYKPQETVCLENDIILYCDDEIIITSWNALKKRHDFASGYSCYYMDRGFKVSKFLDSYGNLVYWYCDIIETVIDKNIYTFNDLLLDVIVHKSGKVEVLDISDLADVYERGLITAAQLSRALRSLDDLLRIIYSDRFNELTLYIEKYCSISEVI